MTVTSRFNQSDLSFDLIIHAANRFEWEELQSVLDKIQLTAEELAAIIKARQAKHGEHK